MIQTTILAAVALEQTGKDDINIGRATTLCGTSYPFSFNDLRTISEQQHKRSRRAQEDIINEKEALKIETSSTGETVYHMNLHPMLRNSQVLLLASAAEDGGIRFLMVVKANVGRRELNKLLEKKMEKKLPELIMMDMGSCFERFYKGETQLDGVDPIFYVHKLGEDRADILVGNQWKVIEACNLFAFI